MDDLMVALKDVASPWQALQPPNRIRVSEGAARSLMIKRPGGASGYWNPMETPYMVEPVDTLGSRRHSAVCFVGPAQCGKCLDVDTPIPTPSGWTTMGALNLGDEVFGPDGVPTRVMGVSEVKHGRPCFEVRLKDGSAVVADDEHLWGVERLYRHGQKWRYEVRSTAEIAPDLLADGHGRYRIRNVQAVEYPRTTLRMDPYLLGLWVGDGSSDRAVLSAHQDDVVAWLSEIDKAGHRGAALPHHGKAFRISIDAGVKGSRAAPGSFTSLLKAEGLLGNKHLPAAYLRASVKDRWSLLQGLMDTDGHAYAGKSTAVFSSASEKLAEQVVELCRSLGLTPTMYHQTSQWGLRGERRTGKAFRVSFSAPEGTKVFRLHRKQNTLVAPTRDVQSRRIEFITPVETRPVKCIKVARDDGLFVCGKGFVVTHNTVGLLDGWMTHTVVNDPGDMLVVSMTQDKAREFSKQRIDRAIKNSPHLTAMKSSQARDDNLHDKQFRNGMWVRIAWPTATNLSSTSYRYVAGTDYDRWPDDIDGEGDGFTLMGKRITTFLSRGMVAVESSPGRAATDPSWRPATAHEAPPVGGILGIYNRSDRRRWYWKCPHCAEWMQSAPGLGLFGLPTDDELLDQIRDIDIDAMARQYARVICPASGCVIAADQREGMNRAGRWLADGLEIDAQDRISGTARTSSIAGFWMGGAAATYVGWESLIRKHLQALLEYALNGSELQLQTTANTDQGVPYMSRLLAEAARNAGRGMQTEQNLERYVVPEWARFIVASVDVQGGKNARFVVQVHAVGKHKRQQLIDRREITRSMREGMGDDAAPLDPASYAEDWDTLTDQVVKATYRTSDPNREMRVKLVVVDSGGEDGVTDKAYAWYRRLRRDGLHHRVRLTKGANTRTEWYVKETMVGGVPGRTDGDIPLQLLDPNKFKDMVAAGLARTEPGPGYYHWPMPHDVNANPDGWLKKAFFDELKAEVRNENGVWEQIKKRNESFDLCYMILAGCYMLGCDRREFWENLPGWAAEWDRNSEIVTPEVRRVEQAERPKREMRVRRSAYMG